MSDPAEPIVLDLRTLPEHCELLRSVAEALAAAATVVLERLQGPGERDLALVRNAEVQREGVVVRTAIDDAARATYDDPQEATEEGAEAVAILVAKRLLDRVVYRRLPKETGADYMMRDPRFDGRDHVERLECSGIGDGRDATARRLEQKIEQLGRYPDEPPGQAIVTNFRTTPIEILVGGYPR